ncbi:KpsF/GutQ family sugar-phosphate isomerase [Endozoicomonas euniceicola]|uniref:Arabinose 5-phosphate isomerase n=1 Tax=Endozoicomonas euniceicola TaxID=1234143 RepID=A0ABY6GR83_9GAMM|nr:KpsF/GutQ family sugar-phosphate isomerase [Endozoicomonas euniceicola]UYM14509.1 KpsF/GutQ family sugar-phosphate isomerase [Endozoicomonas euniceicola]
MTNNDEQFIAIGKRTISMELEAVQKLLDRVNSSFARACEVMLACSGRIIVVGMGKSGHIARKIAATLASTGTPSFFVHPGEASHGDMGMITSEDVVLALSNSGETNEVVTLLPLLKRMGTPLVSMTGNPDSSLALDADAHINTGVDKEACPLDLAPTSSTTTALVMGDALAIALLEARGFTAEDFAFSHPGGSLGKRLLLKVKDVMHSGRRIPEVAQGTKISEALLEMTHKGLGMTSIVDKKRKVVGIFTDGDLRRALDKGVNLRQTDIDDVMTSHCKTISPDILAAEALKIMDDRKINALICVDTDNQPVGAVNMHDLLKAGVV